MLHNDRYFVFDNLISPNGITNLMIHFRNFNDYSIVNRANAMLPQVLHSCTVF